MLRQRAKIIAFYVFLFDLFLVTASFFLAYWIRGTYLFEHFRPLAPIEYYLWLTVFVIPTWSIIAYYCGVYESFRTKPLWVDIWKVFKSTFWVIVLLSVFIFMFKLQFVSRLFITFFGILIFVLISLEKLTIRFTASNVRKKGYNYRNILIVGTGSRAREIVKIIEDHKHWGLKMMGFITDNPTLKRNSFRGYDVIGTVGDLPDIIKRHVVDEIVFAVPRKKLDRFEELFLLCEEQGINTRVALNFIPHMTAKVYLEDLHGVPLLTFSTTPNNEFLLAIKRGFDIAVSTVLLVLLSPLLLASSLLIKLTSRGPLLFKQKRMGLNGRTFTLYKFRSMVQDAEDLRGGVEHFNEMDGPVFKIRKDPRVTKVGRFIRRTSIDELPQLFNVLKGEMSIIGPRPPIPEEVRKYDRWQRRRLSMKPGLTCLWQVSGRNKIGFKKWMEMDLQYIDNWSLGLDLKIFFKTIPAILRGTGA